MGLFPMLGKNSMTRERTTLIIPTNKLITQEILGRMEQNPQHIERVVSQMLWPWLVVDFSRREWMQDDSTTLLFYLTELEHQYPDVLRKGSPYLVDKRLIMHIAADSEVAAGRRDDCFSSSDICQAFAAVLPGEDDSEVENLRRTYWGCRMAQLMVQNRGKFEKNAGDFINDPEGDFATLADPESRGSFPYAQIQYEYFDRQANVTNTVYNDPIAQSVGALAHRVLSTWNRRDSGRHFKKEDVVETMSLDESVDPDGPQARFLAEKVMTEMAKTCLFAPGSIVVSEAARRLKKKIVSDCSNVY